MGRVRVTAGPGHVVSADFAFGGDTSNGSFKTHGHFGFLEPIQHQLGSQKHGDGTYLVLTGVFRGRSVRRFKHSVGVASVQILSARFTSAVE